MTRKCFLFSGITPFSQQPISLCRFQLTLLMIGRVGRTILKNRKTLLAAQTSIRLYSIEDPLSGKSDDFYHYFNLSPADMRKYDRFNYVQPTVFTLVLNCS